MKAAKHMLPPLAVLIAAWCPAQTLALLPGDVTLSRVGQTQRLLVVDARGNESWGDLTEKATWTTSDPNVAIVSPEGVLTAIGNGTAEVVGAMAGGQVRAKVQVVGTEKPFTYSFRNHVEPLLFKMGCNTGPCHGSQSGKNGFKLSLRGFDTGWDHQVITRQANARRVSLANPADSLLLLKPLMEVAHEGGERFTKDSEAYKVLLAWIEAGAPPAHADDPTVGSISVYPSAMTLQPGAEQRLLVQAHYTDGTVENVTTWAKYATTEEAVAGVDDVGRVKIIGAGAGAVTVWYASKLASVEVSVPRAKPVEEKVFAEAQRNNFIDDLVLKKLQALQIPVAAKADDATFVRRAFLDTIGILPKPEDISDFALDAAPDKRAKLIDSLLERSEYVDYWTYKWSDLLLVSSNTVRTAEELNSFYQFIRKSVASNKPWDVFVRDIITAKGNTLENGAGVYYLMHKEITDLTETTSQAFLGMSLTCARCHNHPLEKWTQDDYYGMANLLSRVKLKNGRQGNSTEVQASDSGDVVHPRLGAPLPPKPLDGEAMALDAEGDRRAYFAQWLTAKENPYFARAIVNRVWKNYMGRALVEAEDDLRLTNPASNEELLSAVAADFTAHGFDLKHLMRTIMNSAAYQRVSEAADPEAPDDRFYSQFIVKRLPAEVILDAYSQVTGISTAFSGYPNGTRALQLRDSTATTYFLTAFGRPARKQTCACERTDDATIAQTLHLANGGSLNDKLRNEEGLVAQWVKQDISNADAVNRLFRIALGRYPSARELDASLSALGNENGHWTRRAALEDLAWALMSSKEFLFNH